MASLAHYWASCAGGLEFALIRELESLEGTNIIPGIDSYGGIQFQTTSSVQKVAELRSADNLYAFLSHHKNIPVDKEAGVPFMQSLAGKIDWEPVMQLHRQWQEIEDSSGVNESLLSISGIASADHTRESLQRSFRVTGTRICLNMKKHGYTSMDAAASIGDGIYELLGWPADMRNFNVEVLAWVIDDEILLALALLYSGNKRKAKNLLNASMIDDAHASEEEVVGQAKSTKKKMSADRPSRADAQLYSRRPYRKALVHTSLKPSTAYGLLQLADVQPGDIVLDPMCGCGTIPLEASNWLGTRVMALAGDFVDTAVDAARLNSLANEPAGPSDVVRWDASILPLRTASVDRVICDMPFGNRCGNHKVREVLCPRVVRQVVRVLRPESGVAVLMAQSKAMKEEILVNQKAYLNLQQHFYVNMEGLKVDVFVVRRTTEPAPIQQIERPSKRMAKRKRGPEQFMKQPPALNL